MKKIKLCFLALALFLSFSLASCGNNEKPEDPNQNETPNGGNQVDVDGLKVTVLMPDGTPAKNVQVQWCEKVCKMPVKVDDNGVAILTDYDKGVDYNVHVLKTPEGYGYNPFEVIQNDQNKISTIKLTKLNSIESGDGKITSPYVIKTGMYSITADKTARYYVITPTEAGTYVFESYADETNDPYISYYGQLPNPEYQKKYSEDDGNAKNFKFELVVSQEEVAENKTFVFSIKTKEEISANFVFTVIKK